MGCGPERRFPVGRCYRAAQPCPVEQALDQDCRAVEPDHEPYSDGTHFLRRHHADWNFDALARKRSATPGAGFERLLLDSPQGRGPDDREHDQPILKQGGVNIRVVRNGVLDISEGEEKVLAIAGASDDFCVRRPDAGS